MKSTTHHRIALVSFAVFAVGCLTVEAQRQQGPPSANARMSGTYQLETTRGGDPRSTAAAATRSLPPGQRDRAYQSLLERLEPPQMLSLERNGRTMTIESSRGPRSIFDADGRNQSERWDNGRTVTTRAEIVGNQVRVSTSGGSRGSDFYVTFESLNNGANLRVTRRLDDDDLRRPVTIQSYYRRTAPMARWDIFGPGPGRATGRGNDDRYGDAMAVPDGTRLMATLDTHISIRNSRSGEPFTMTVRNAGEFQGARLTGVITRVNGRNAGRGDGRGGDGPDLRVDFQSIEWRGRSSEFDAFINTIRLSDNSVLRLRGDDDRNDNRDTIRNGAIGAAVGAVIGAIAGGGKGAAIGAIVGGAGGVIISQGREQLDLPRGSEVTLTAVSPYRSR